MDPSTLSSRRVVIPVLLAFAIGVLVGLLWPRGRSTSLQTVSTKQELNPLARLSSAFLRERFVAYSPSEFNPLLRDAEPISDESIRADLRVVRSRFSAIVTYSCDPRPGLDRIVHVAREVDMRVIVGIWDVRSVVELETAVHLAKEFPDTVVGVLVGNETMLRGGKWEQLEAAIRLVKTALPDVPVSTSEPISAYGNEDLRSITDFHAPNIHWIFHSNQRQDIDGALEWLLERTQALQEIAPKPTLTKEHGLPSGPEPFSELLQSNYWAKLVQRAPNSVTQAIAFFEAFDLPFKTNTQQSELSATEAHWGAWNVDRQPKPVLSVFPARTTIGDTVK